jgi:hypothetical protein
MRNELLSLSDHLAILSLKARTITYKYTVIALFSGAPSRTRTDTGRILSPLSLPLDYGGDAQTKLTERKSTGFGEDLLHRPRLEYSGKGVLLAWMVGT